jgi:hypothetical protein
MTTDSRETMRKAQLKILRSKSVQNIYLAARGRNISQYGQEGMSATIENYLQGLSKADASTSKLVAHPLLGYAQAAMKAGRNPYEEGALTPTELLNNSVPFYQSAINHVKVSDVLGLLRIEDVHESRITNDQKEMYMEDLKASNEGLYNLLVETYFGKLEKVGVGTAIKAQGEALGKGLEEVLKSDANAATTGSR